MQQAPGPRESPQVDAPGPQAGAAGAALPLVLAANTENCCARLCPWHFGHSALREPMMSASKGFWQSLQMYSKMGIVNCGYVKKQNHSAFVT